MTEIQIKNLINYNVKNMKKNILSLWKLRNYHSIR